MSNPYLGYITREHAGAAKFTRLVGFSTATYRALADALNAFQAEFDIDSAVGAQLDAIGLWLGLPRDLIVKVTDSYFTFDDTAAPTETGWDYGVWLGRFGDPTGIEAMPDDVYRRALKAKAVSNRWDGTLAGIHAIWSAYAGSRIVITDNQDMTMAITVQGRLSGLEKALLKQGYITIRPAGVAVSSFTFE
jgi:hypothetical protein